MWYSTKAAMFSVVDPDPLTIGLTGGAVLILCGLCTLKGDVSLSSIHNDWAINLSIFIQIG